MRPLLVVSVLMMGCSPSGSQPLPATVERLSVSGPVSVRVLVGSSFEPELRVEHGGLDRSITSRSLSLTSTEDHGPITVLLPALRQVQVDDGAVVTISAMQGGRIGLEAAGGARVLVERLDADSLVVSAAESGSVDVGGRARAVTAVARELSKIDLGALRAEVTRVEVSDLSNVRVTAGQVLRALVSHGSRVTVDRLPESRQLTVDQSSAVQVGSARTGPVSKLDRP